MVNIVGDYQHRTAYEMFIVIDGAILAALAATILHYLAETTDFTRIYLTAGNATNFVSGFDPIGCATINYQIVLVTFVSGIITAIPLFLVGIAWVFDKKDLDVRRYLLFPAVGVALHLVYVYYQQLNHMSEFGCILRLNIF